jgi:hypothetical protein
MCPSGATCLPVDCCFSELTLYKIPTQYVGLVQSGHHHHQSHKTVTCSRKDIC